MEDGEEKVDVKFKRLEYLLGQSKIYASILMQKMQKQEDDAIEQAQGDKERAAKREAAAEKAAEASQRKITRAAAGRSSTPAQGTQKKDELTSKRPSTRAKAKGKAGGDLKISQFFKKDDLKAKAGNESLAEAMEEAAEENSVKPSAIGMQDLRSARQPELVTGGNMRTYQLEGLDWLISLFENGLNGILADEMGLGKTVQTIAFLAFLRSKGVNAPFLIAGPLSTLSNWVEEFAKWTPDIPVVLYHGSKSEREEIRRKQLKDPRSPHFPVVCTSYEICMNDQKFLSKYAWKFIIIDEGHRIKNLNCRLIRELKSYHSANRLLITGTPLQNNLSELWSLLNFLMPDIFDELSSFESWFDFSELKNKEGHKQILVGERKSSLIASLHAILKPFLLRRVKADVESSLPKKREYILYAPLSGAQRELYREILEGNSRAYLEEKAVERIMSSTNNPKSMRSHSLKRKIDSSVSTPNKSVKSSRESSPSSVRTTRSGNKKHSYKEISDREFFKQLDQEENDEEEPDSEELEEIERSKTIALAKKEIASKKLQNPIMQLRLACNSPHNFYWPWENDAAPDSTLISESGKMLLLERLLPALFARGHKVLVFSQFKTTLNIIEDWARLIHSWNTCRIDGAVKQEDRRAQIHAFNSNPGYKLFLLSTRAGGLGINLAAADTVVLFDSDWNPQQDLQAQDRAHRIGQTRPVIVYRLATKGTVEQTLLEKADAKRRLEKLVIQKGKFKSLSSVTQNKEDFDELQRVLMQDDFEKYELSQNTTAEGILSDRDLEILTDRSEEAYERAQKGVQEEKTGEGTVFKTVETKKDGTNGILDELKR
ncbi:hypothetical protein L228DRAFT_209998 [Xylona heveae TC161]|uniref:SNF2 family helicase/ATPase PasG n=1 Tax=Xylona heveae (strain CBS 132557 / TC161) TaxID=1328760 RepID=A0A165HGG6_XYLHT|nr:hypothetical protein L228DRAFT_209998 [Xylona heveae TC161]KZF23476.1 hypothetical protein L228DRAFT_209998 [Xylona heveae TC161]